MRKYRRVLVARVGVLAPIAAVSLGCVPSVESKPVKGPITPDAQQQSTTLKERQDASPDLAASLSDTKIDAQLQKRTECRDVVVSPTVQERTEKRTLSGGATSYYINGGAAALLGGIGAAVAFGNCSRSVAPTTGNPNPPDRACTSDEASGTKTAGYIIMGTAAIPLALIAINVLRSRDETKIGPGEPLKTPSDWKTCGTKPLANEPVTMGAGKSTLRGTTGSDGHVIFDLAAVEPTPDLVRSPSATVRHEGQKDVTVDLSATPLLAQWRTTVEANAAQAKAEQERKEQQRREEQAARELEISRLKGECDQGKPESCYQLADKFPGSAGLPYLKSACDLNYQAGCIAYQMRLDEEAQRRAAADQARQEGAQRQAQAQAAQANPLNGVPVESFKERCQRGGQSSGTACGLYQWASQCQQGTASGCDSLAKAYASGLAGPKDENIAKRLLMAACTQGSDARSCTGYGIVLSAGQGGFSRDEAKASEFFHIACRADAEQCAVIGVLYRNGRGGVRQDSSKATEYLKAGCDAGSASSCQIQGRR